MRTCNNRTLTTYIIYAAKISLILFLYLCVFLLQRSVIIHRAKYHHSASRWNSAILWHYVSNWKATCHLVNFCQCLLWRYKKWFCLLHYCDIIYNYIYMYKSQKSVVNACRVPKFLSYRSSHYAFSGQHSRAPIQVEPFLVLGTSR